MPGSGENVVDLSASNRVRLSHVVQLLCGMKNSMFPVSKYAVLH